MTNKEKYQIICADEISVPVYSRDWWLDITCGKNKWDVLLYEKNGKIEAAMPFYRPNKSLITMPEYTQTMGIWFNPAFENEKYYKNLSRKQVISDYFIEHLPPHRYFLQNFHSSFTDWLPFYWKDFHQTTRYNYILPNIENTDELWNNLSEDARRNILKAKDKYKLTVQRMISTDLFLALQAKTYARQGMRAYQPALLKKLIEATRARNQGDIWGALDENGRLHSAQFIVCQKNVAYCIASGFDSELRKSGAHAYVLWVAIGELANEVTSFDFSGTMVQGIEYFNKSFGAVQVPYFTISKGKMSLLRRVIQKSKKLLQNK